MDLSFVISAGISVAALAAAALIVFRTMRMGRSRTRASDPFIVFPVRDGVAPIQEPPAPVREASPYRAPADTAEPPGAAPVEPVVSEPRTPFEHERYMPPPDAAIGPESELIQGHTISFYRPAEGTLQLLPGRLEIIDGADRGQEIRFVRPGEGTPEITFGRSNGPPLRHIQLRAGTVSRKHAQMRLEDGRWQIRNLSRTNPVLLNGEELQTGNGSRVLYEGDRIEMGELIFRFRER